MDPWPKEKSADRVPPTTEPSVKHMKTHPPAPAAQEPILLTVSRFFSVPAERVFDAWLDRASVGRWLFATPGGEMQRVEMDARANGKFVIVEKRGPALAEHFGTYHVIERPGRLVFSFAMNPEDKPTRVTVRIEPMSVGCKLTLTHELSPAWAGIRQKVHAGWTMILEALAAKILGERDFVISRVFDAPRGLVWKAWTDDKQMEWWGPKGVTIHHAELDLRPGGIFHYAMRAPDGREMWGKWVILEIVPPERLVFVSSFSDEAGGIRRHPMAATWPLEVLSTITFDEQEGRTLLTVRWLPVHATEVESKTFEASHESMKAGWTGTLDRLAEHLAKD